jgi:hypothetical protein
MLILTDDEVLTRGLALTMIKRRIWCCCPALRLSRLWFNLAACKSSIMVEVEIRRQRETFVAMRRFKKKHQIQFLLKFQKVFHFLLSVLTVR